MREKLASRLGFIMLAAGCAVGLGNVWRFSFIVGQNGGAAFVLIYFAFLALFGFPLLIAELSLGRASASGISGAFAALSRRGKRFWHALGAVIFTGNILLMLYYTDVGGWLLQFTGSYVKEGYAPEFSKMTADTGSCAGFMALSVIIAVAVCACGVQKGVERITKWMMLSLLALIAVLAVKALTLEGAAKGLEFYLKPDWGKVAARPFKVVFDAMGQAFFTLSVGVGCMTIFGSYIGRTHSLVKDSVFIVVVDTFVAFVSGLIIFPACATYGVAVDSGPGLIFEALPKVFAAMDGGRIWGAAFFLFLSLAALTTVIAVFECIIGGIVDEMRFKRLPVTLAVGILVMLGSLPTVFVPGVLEIEDFVFSQFWLPLGALASCIFVSRDFGWGFGGFREEACAGEGFGMSARLKTLYAWIIPAMIIMVLIGGMINS
jgi:NSS family neurotransmitter:Na+ symporter